MAYGMWSTSCQIPRFRIRTLILHTEIALNPSVRENKTVLTGTGDTGVGGMILKVA